jgi:FkbM family methyltransferase
MSIVSRLGRRLGNELYHVAFPVYRPLYSAFKTYADRAERHLLASHLSAGSVAVDVGANIGIYSQFFSKCVGPTGFVHSFEPDPTNFLRLRQLLADTPNVRLNELALSDKTEASSLYASDHLNVDHRSYPTEGESRRVVNIQAVALDDYFKSGERVDLIKMDIQGYELHALQGAERVISDNPQINLLVEFWPYGLRCAGSSEKDLLASLRHKGFRFFLVANGLLTPCPEPNANPDDPDDYFNLFARRLDPVKTKTAGIEV